MVQEDVVNGSGPRVPERRQHVSFVKDREKEEVQSRKNLGVQVGNAGFAGVNGNVLPTIQTKGEAED